MPNPNPIIGSDSVVNYAEKYEKELANAYPHVLHFAALRDTENDRKYRFVDAKTIQIPKLKTGGRVDADRDNIGTFKRNYENDWETKTLSFHREFSTLVHPMDIDETNQVASIGNITQAFNEQQKFPEMDDYLVSKLYADWTEAGGVAKNDTVVSEENVLALIDDMMVYADEHNVPAVGRILYVTPLVNKAIKRAKEISRSIDVSGNNGKDINRLIANLDEVKIEKVPSVHMLTAYDFDEGSKPGSSAKQIQMFMAHPTAIMTPDKYSTVLLTPPAAHTKGKYVYYEEDYGDVFIMEERKDAFQFVTTTRATS